MTQQVMLKKKQVSWSLQICLEQYLLGQEIKNKTLKFLLPTQNSNVVKSLDYLTADRNSNFTKNYLICQQWIVNKQSGEILILIVIPGIDTSLGTDKQYKVPNLIKFRYKYQFNGGRLVSQNNWNIYLSWRIQILKLYCAGFTRRYRCNLKIQWSLPNRENWTICEFKKYTLPWGTLYETESYRVSHSIG